MTEAPFEGRVAVVTGGAQGIGRAISERFVADGARVAILDANRENAEAAASQIGTADTVIGLRCDVRDGDEVEQSFARAAEAFGKIDVLVNNAGITRDNLVHKMTLSDWSDVIDVHLKGSFLCSQVAQRHMVPNGYGKIVMMSSRAALGNRGQTNYSSAKAGLQGMTRTLAIELGPFGINVNCIAPGHIHSAMTEATAVRMGIDYEAMCQATINANAIKRVGEPVDVANLAAFLASDQSSYLTGQVIYLAGRPVS